MSDDFRLTHEHFDAAKVCPNAFEMIHWAFECQATVEEMEAWGRAARGEPPLVRKPKPKVLFE